jgi:cytochrome P450
LLCNLVVLIFAGFETTTGLLTMGVHELLKRPEQWQYLKSQLVQGPEVSVDGAVVKDHELRWYLWADHERNLKGPLLERYQALTAKLERSEALKARKAQLEAQEQVLDRAVEDMLRYTAPGSVIPLALNEDYKVVFHQDTNVDGRAYKAGESLTLHKGQMVNIAVDELNRRCPFSGGRFDSQATGEFDVTREDNSRHLAFGRAHACIGAKLAKENMRRALEALMRRFPDIQLNGSPGPQEFDLFNGLASLPVKISFGTPASSSSIA